MSVFDIPAKAKGDGIKAVEFNSLVDAAKGFKSPGKGFFHEIMGSVAQPTTRQKDWLVGVAGSSVDPYSVFCVTTGEATLSDLPKFRIDTPFGDGTTITTLFTNGDLALTEDKPGFVRPIGFGEAFKIRITGGQPEPGDHMGVRPGTFTLERVSDKHRHGFVCLNRDSEHAWVVRTTNDSFVCKTTEAVTARSGDTLGEGNAEVYYRQQDSATLTGLIKPGGGSDKISFKLYNVGPSIASGTYVLATGVTGVGLVVERVMGTEEKYAFSIGGTISPYLTNGGTNLLMDSFIHNDTGGVEAEPDAIIPDKYTGVQIVRRGRWAIFTKLSIHTSSASNDGVVMMLDTESLFSKFKITQARFALTVNDTPTTPAGVPVLAGRDCVTETWSNAKDEYWETSDAYWFETDDVLRLFFRKDSSDSIGVTFGMWGFWMGDYAPEWTPDGATP